LNTDWVAEDRRRGSPLSKGHRNGHEQLRRRAPTAVSCERVPELCRFHGILIAMFFNDHSPPHFHARYSGQEVKIAIDGLSVLDGRLPGPQTSLVRQWARLHQDELRRCWEAARRHEMPERIDPLP